MMKEEEVPGGTLMAIEETDHHTMTTGTYASYYLHLLFAFIGNVGLIMLTKLCKCLDVEAHPMATDSKAGNIQKRGIGSKSMISHHQTGMCSTIYK